MMRATGIPRWCIAALAILFVPAGCDKPAPPRKVTPPPVAPEPEDEPEEPDPPTQPMGTWVKAETLSLRVVSFEKNPQVDAPAPKAKHAYTRTTLEIENHGLTTLKPSARHFRLRDRQGNEFEPAPFFQDGAQELFLLGVARGQTAGFVVHHEVPTDVPIIRLMLTDAISVLPMLIDETAATTPTVRKAGKGQRRPRIRRK